MIYSTLYMFKNFFTLRLEDPCLIGKGEYVKQQTRSLVPLISYCTKLARTSCLGKRQKLYPLTMEASAWLVLILTSGRISLVHYSPWSPEMTNLDMFFGGYIFSALLSVNMGSESILLQEFSKHIALVARLGVSWAM